MSEYSKEDVELTEAMKKVTVLLPPDTVAKLDTMMKNALLGSRGRTIQMIVDEIYEVQVDLREYMRLIQTDTFSQNSTATILRLIICLGNINRRLGKFWG